MTPLQPQLAPIPEGMVRLGIRQPVAQYLQDVYERRDYLATVSRATLHRQNYDTVLGNVWHVLDPLLQVAIYFVIFGVILGTDRGIENFIAYLTVGVFTFNFSQKCAVRGAKAITSNEGLIRSLRFPRLLLPLEVVTTETFAQLPKVLVMLLVTVVFGEIPVPTWLLIVPIIAVQIVFNVGLASTTARLNDTFRDFENVLPYFFRITFYLSGIIYSVDHRVQTPLYRALFQLNPFYCFPEAMRAAVFGEWAAPGVYLSILLWTVGLVTFGVLFFKAAEHRYGRG